MSCRTPSITRQAYHYGISDRSNKGITEEKTDGTWMEWWVKRADAESDERGTESGEGVTHLHSSGPWRYRGTNLVNYK